LGFLAPHELARWYARASIYVLPARYEPFGYSALEAALAGCALVLGDIPSLREIWGSAATFVPPDDSLALRQSLQKLIERPALRREMAKRANSRARQFTPDRMASAYVDVYESVTTGRLACAS
jgi:glycosyltransferase involved in cell wall biosynthesis